MARGKSFEVGGEFFGTKKSLQEYIRSILHSYGDGDELDDQDFEFMSDLLKFHSSYEQKCGRGVKTMFVRRNREYGNMGFWLQRVDGTETDFSYIECLSPSSHRKEFERACRVAISPYIVAFKQNFFDYQSKDEFCPYTGDLLTFETAHVDHAAPFTFQKILDDFIYEAGIDVSSIGVLGKNLDGVTGNTLADKDLETAWVVYHNTYAVLRVVSQRANLSHLRRSMNRSGK